MCSCKKIDYLSNLQKDVKEELASDISNYKSDSLLSLTKNSKDGISWYWVVDETKTDNEWSLVCLNSKTQSIDYEVESFTKWVELLVDSKNSVITTLQDKINTGITNENITSSYLK